MALAANAARIVKQSSQIINRFLFCCIPSVWHPYTEYIGLVSDLYLRESLIVWLANKFFHPQRFGTEIAQTAAVWAAKNHHHQNQVP